MKRVVLIVFFAGLAGLFAWLWFNGPALSPFARGAAECPHHSAVNDQFAANNNRTDGRNGDVRRAAGHSR